MMLPILANVEWPSAVVACVLIFCLTAGFIAAVMRYNIDGAMKLAGYFTGFLGLILGTILTYFSRGSKFNSRYPKRKASKPHSKPVKNKGLLLDGNYFN